MENRDKPCISAVFHAFSTPKNILKICGNFFACAAFHKLRGKTLLTVEEKVENFHGGLLRFVILLCVRYGHF